ncbi:hypothetical protein QAD02_011694 [Eretmocerus hayati]|uniref:Uncharacterized protein n=1 Tax=Eretmocerus hayati TaxID=131215 RepID=A0ACC2NXG3_9HYME|nr:hypothetical protein QAD02_011694 [Eretmocerus hayati]
MDRDQSGNRVNKNLDVVTKAQLLDEISEDEWEFIQQIRSLPELDITMSDQREEQCETQNLEVNTVEFGGESVTNSSSTIIANSEMPSIFAHAVDNPDLRVQSIALDLMECEKSRSAQGPDEILMEIGLVPSNMNIVSNTTSSDNTYPATGNSATTDFPKYSEPSAVAANNFPMDDHGYSVNLPVYDEINSTEAMRLQEVNHDPINTPVPEYGKVIDNHNDNKEKNDAHGIISLTEEKRNNEAQMEFLQWYAPGQCKNTVATKRDETLESPTKQDIQLESNNTIVTVEIHSVEVENELVVNQESGTPNNNFQSDRNTTDTSANDGNLTEAPRDAASDTPNINENVYERDHQSRISRTGTTSIREKK